MVKTAVILQFEGSVLVEVDADPNDEEVWAAAIGDAWANLGHRRVNEAASLISHEIVKVFGEV